MLTVNKIMKFVEQLNLSQLTKVSSVASSEQHTKMIELSIKELRRVYDRIGNHYDQLRIKALSMIGAEGAVVGFIFGSGQKLNIPAATDRRIFFWAAITLLALTFGLLLWIVSTVQWQLPHDLEHSSELIARHRSYDTYLKYLHDDLIQAININRKVVEPKAGRFNISIYLLAAGAIILLVLKYGGNR